MKTVYACKSEIYCACKVSGESLQLPKQFISAVAPVLRPFYVLSFLAIPSPVLTFSTHD